MKIHIIGIGGIGVSALAQYYLEKGHKVSGSDLESSEIIKLLKKKGAKIIIGPHKQENLPKDADLAVYSPAVKKDSPELKKAKESTIKIQSYPEALGDLTREYFAIAVSGTHGKSTTTAMTSLVLIKAGLDPTVIVGTKLKEFKNSNFRLGKSKYLVIEACEYEDSFLNYHPDIIVLTNIEKEHMDYFKNMGRVFASYKKYISRLSEKGILVFNGDDKNILKIKNQKGTSSACGRAKIRFKIQKYSLKQKEAKVLEKIIRVPGKHYLSNSLAVLAVSRALKIPDKVFLKALGEYEGAWRRFEIFKKTINSKKITVISDYGHHPTEIKTTLEAVRQKFPKRRIWVVFQPHQYQRTFYLFNDFIKVFRSAPIDEIIIADIYDVAGREDSRINLKVSSKKLVEKIKRPNVVYLAKEGIKPYFRKVAKNNDILVVMGAGDIYKLVGEI